MLSHHAGDAFIELTLRIMPESLAAHLFRDGGQWAIEFATKILTTAIDKDARATAERLLKKVLQKVTPAFPPKGRA